MSRSIAIALAIAASSFLQPANADTSYVVHAWPGDLAQLPCDAWTHNANGSWTQTGTITVEASTMIIKGNTFTGGDIAAAIDKKCGGSK